MPRLFMSGGAGHVGWGRRVCAQEMPSCGRADHALRRVRPDGMRRTTVCGRSIPTGLSWTACARGLDGLGGPDEGEVVGTGGAWSVVGAGRHEGGHDAGGVRPAGARASRPLPLAGPAGSTRERRERAGVGRWGGAGCGRCVPTGRTTATQVRPTVDWSTAGWGVSGPMGAGQPTDGGVAPLREPSALHDGRGWGGAHLQPWPGVDLAGTGGAGRHAHGPLRGRPPTG